MMMREPEKDPKKTDEETAKPHDSELQEERPSAPRSVTVTPEPIGSRAGVTR